MRHIVCTTILVETSPQALPLGAACIASSLKENSFISSQCVTELEDFSLENKELSSLLTDEQKASFIACELLRERKLFVLAVSVYVWNRALFDLVCKKIKQLSPSTFIIAGGPEITANPFSFSSSDFCAVGEGEVSVVELVENLLKNKNVLPKGVYNSENGALKVFERSPAPDLTALPSPWLNKTIDSKKYGGVLWELARGCPFKCSYCYESRGEKKVRHFPLERLEKELQLFSKQNVAQVFVLDPTYNADKKTALQMLKLIKKYTPKTFYYFEARAEFIDKELANAFSNINCALQFGLQSADSEVLKKVNRSLDKKLFARNIGFLNNAGVVFGFDLIYGLPGDTLNGFKNSIDFALSLYPNNLELFCLSVLPGTDLHEKAKDLALSWQSKPPYNVLYTSSMTEADIKKASELSKAVNVFYTLGRAVPWFNSVCALFHKKPSLMLTLFTDFLREKNLLEKNKEYFTFEKILSLQIEFLNIQLKEKKMLKLSGLIHDILTLNAAISEATATAKESVFSLRYHPDDLMSEYASDIAFFYSNAREIPNRTKVYCSGIGVDWKTL